MKLPLSCEYSHQMVCIYTKLHFVCKYTKLYFENNRKFTTKTKNVLLLNDSFKDLLLVRDHRH